MLGGAGFAVALEMVVQLALQDIGQLTDLNRGGGSACNSPVNRPRPPTPA
jgi:hypothetical protein